MKTKSLIILSLILFFSCSRKDSYVAPTYSEEDRQSVVIKTSIGNIELQLYNDLTPNTVKNFVDLAEGKKEYIHPVTNKRMQKNYYDNTIFHRVIDDFMIQGGDPSGTGRGGPGYTFRDEIFPPNKNDRGTISMANRGRNTNGAQFFINLTYNQHLNRGHTVFGKVTKGMEVVDKIAKVKVNRQDKPLTPIIIQSIRLKK